MSPLINCTYLHFIICTEPQTEKGTINGERERERKRKKESDLRMLPYA